MNSGPIEHLITDQAFARAARQAVLGALGGDFSVDPIVGPALSRCFSVIGSLIQRHGLLIQRTLADALLASGRFDVLFNVQIPLTETARDLLVSRNAPGSLAKINLQSDSRAIRMVTLDLLVIDLEARWAGVYDVKRGNGASDNGKRRKLERDLHGVRLVLADHLVKLGYEGIDDVTVGIIDYYGLSTFSREIKILGCELDEHFGVPVMNHVEALTEALGNALQAELPDLLRPALQSLARAAPPAPTAAPDPGPAKASEAAAGRLNVRPSGPGPRRNGRSAH